MGRATELLQMPTRMLMAGGANRRRKVIAIVAALLAAAGVGTAGAVFALDSAKVGNLHKDWGTFQGCMLGEALKADESPAQRYRLLWLAQSGTPLEKRAAAKGQAWPASCLASLAAVEGNAARAPAGDELGKASAALGKALTAGTLHESPKLLDAVWKAASTSKLGDPPAAADPSTPKAVAPLFARAAFEAQPRPLGDFALAALRSELSPSARLRFLVDDRSTPTGPVLCHDQAGAPGSLGCKALHADVAKLSPGLRLLGTTVDSGSAPLLFAGERGRGGVFRDLSAAVVQGPSVLGATALDGGRVRLLVAKKEAGLAVVESGGKDRPSEVAVRGVTDGALVADYLVSRSPAGHLLVQRVGVGINEPSVDAGELAEALATSRETVDERAAFCRVPGTEALRLRGAQSDFVSLGAGGRWSAPQKVGRTEQLSCADGVAVLATTTHEETNARIHATVRVDRCTSSGCKQTRLSHYDMVAGLPDLMPTSRAGVAAAVAGNRMYLAWFTSMGDLRVRTGTIDGIAAAADVVVYEGSSGPEQQNREVALIPSTQGTLLLVRTADGVRAFSYGPDGALAAAPVTL
jgi:hypothetical protein